MEFSTLTIGERFPVPETNKRYYYVNGCLYRRTVRKAHTRNGWKRRETFRGVRAKSCFGKTYFEIWLKGVRSHFTPAQLKEMCNTIEF